jgi:hypothetical protein
MPATEVGGGAELPLSMIRAGVPPLALTIGLLTNGTVPLGTPTRVPER